MSVACRIRELKRQFAQERAVRKQTEEEIRLVQRQLTSNLSEANVSRMNVITPSCLSGEFGAWQRKLARARKVETNVGNTKKVSHSNLIVTHSDLA